jgi:hypothetical protein
MAIKYHTQIIHCPLRQREVEVKYTVSGNWFNRKYSVASCPSMYDRTGCDRRCENLLR